MAVSICIPKLGMAMAEATLAEWKASEGDSVEQGSAVLTIESEKVSWDIEADISGFLHIMVEAGEIAKVAAVVGQIAETKDELAELQKATVVKVGTSSDAESLQAEPEKDIPKSSEVKEAVVASTAAKSAAKKASPAARSAAKKLGIDIALVPGTGARITKEDVEKFNENKDVQRITPLAKSKALDTGVDISAVEGTGVHGKIMNRDIENALQKKDQSPVSEVEVIPLTTTMKTIAKALFESVHQAALASIFTEADVTEMEVFLKELNVEREKEKEIKISRTDFLNMAVCRALKKVSILNSTFDGEELKVYKSVNMGLAVATPKGLVVPVIRNADKKGLFELAHDRRDLATRAREGNLTMDDMQGATFTVSNVTMFAIDGTTAILNRPQNAIIAFGRIKQKPVVYKNQIAIRSIMVMNITFNHQIIDGAVVSQFFEILNKYFDNPSLMIC